MDVDYHVHSTYSDGQFMWSMCQAAADAELEGIGFADHCNVSSRRPEQLRKMMMGFTLDSTYEQRLTGIDVLRNEFDIQIYNGVEIDFDSRDTDLIRDFLTEAQFQYTIGSVHYLDGMNIHVQSYFDEKSEAERIQLVEEYFSELEKLFRSNLFDIAAHIDLIERNPALRGLATQEQYHRISDVATVGNTLIEINAGRALSDYGQFHPASPFLDIIKEKDIEFVLSSDSHTDVELRNRVPALRQFAAEHDITPMIPDDIV